MTRLVRVLALLTLGLMLAGCAMTMKQQPKYEPLARSEFYPDGSSARHPPANTVARGVVANLDPALATGKLDGAPVTAFPFIMNSEDLRRGQSIFNDVCAPCHGRAGRGDGVVVQRGFTRPPNLSAPNIVAMPVGQLYDYSRNGFGAMPPYGPIVQPTDLWRVIGYVRALQLSQTGTIDDVPPELRDQIRPAGGEQ